MSADTSTEGALANGELVTKHFKYEEIDGYVVLTHEGEPAIKENDLGLLIPICEPDDFSKLTRTGYSAIADTILDICHEFHSSLEFKMPPEDSDFGIADGDRYKQLLVVYPGKDTDIQKLAEKIKEVIEDKFGAYVNEEKHPYMQKLNDKVMLTAKGSPGIHILGILAHIQNDIERTALASKIESLGIGIPTTLGGSKN
jgi:hypothetical protein